MLLDERRLPFDDPGWVFELKYDGYRLLAEWGPEGVKLKTKRGADATRWFPEISRSLVAVGGGRHVVDGEVCVLDDIGRSDFDRLHARARLRRYAPDSDIVAFCVFDLLVQDGRSLLEIPLLERKERLQSVLAGEHLSLLRVSHVPKDGEWLFEQAKALKLEGIVAKKADSIYRPGDRSGDWLKIKPKGAIPTGRFRRLPETAPGRS